MNRRIGWATIVLGVSAFFRVPGVARAQEIYRWTDKEGRVHFSNLGPRSGETSAGVSREPAPETTAPEPGAPPSSAAEPESKHSALSEDQFSATVTATRMRLKRELEAAKTEAREAGEKLEALKHEADRPIRAGLEILQRAYGPDRHVAAEEDELRARKTRADERIREIRKEYAELHDEAVKRFGHQPSWWLPIE